MHESTQDAAAMHGIDLARAPDFDLGGLRVRPAKCEVEWSDASETLQRRVMQVLVVLADARGLVVSQDDLIARCWRGLSVSDDAIFRCISKLRKLAAGFPDPPYAIETIPGVGYQLTSPSFVEHIAQAGPVSDRRKRFRLLGTALAILILIGAAVWIAGGRDAPDHRQLHVEVQPFDALNDSDGVRELTKRIPNEVVDALGDSQIEAVLGDPGGRTASLAAGLIVTGAVRGDAANRVVDVRIEDGATRTALWATEFTRRSNQVSDLPLEVAARVTDVVNMINFARGSNPPLTDDSSLSGLLQTTDMIRDAHGGAWAQMIEHAQGIVARHPEFAFGHDVLAYAYWEAANEIDVPDRARVMTDAARGEANLTLKLDPQDAGAYTILAGLEPAYDYAAQEAILLRGIKTARHPKEALGGLYSGESGLEQNVGRLREGLATQLAAHAVDQWGAPKTAKLAFTYANIGNLTAARALIQRGIRLWPNHSGIRARTQFIAGFYEQPSDSLRILDSLDALASPHESNAIWRSFVEAKAVHSERETVGTIRKIREAAGQGKVSPEVEIMMLADLGATKQAMETTNSALDHQQLEAWFLFTPITRNLRQDPGFVGLADRMGLIKYWRETRKLPDFCTSDTSRGECSPELLAALKP
jgi:DNA-binding winged helix-turn-helix (wHTH) protein/tetratricopeptide (TPR) repeat protein